MISSPNLARLQQDLLLPLSLKSVSLFQSTLPQFLDPLGLQFFSPPLHLLPPLQLPKPTKLLNFRLLLHHLLHSHHTSSTFNPMGPPTLMWMLKLNSGRTKENRILSLGNLFLLPQRLPPRLSHILLHPKFLFPPLKKPLRHTFRPTNILQNLSGQNSPDVWLTFGSSWLTIPRISMHGCYPTFFLASSCQPLQVLQERVPPRLTQSEADCRGGGKATTVLSGMRLCRSQTVDQESAGAEAHPSQKSLSMTRMWKEPEAWDRRVNLPNPSKLFSQMVWLSTPQLPWKR